MSKSIQDLTKPRITTEGSYRIGEYEPGNGTRYTAVAIPWTNHPDLMMGALGAVTNGWLVTSGNSSRSYLFQQHGNLLDKYIQEKLGGYGGDYPYFGDLIRQLIARPGLRPLIGDMPDDPEFYYNERAERMP